MWEVNYLNSLITLLFFVALIGTGKFILSYNKSRDIKRVNLLKNIDQKLFMTAWLGFSFTILFLIMSFLASRLLDKSIFLSLFAYGKENPSTFFYLGGALFSSTTVLVYIIRRVGICVYLNMGKAKKKKKT